MRPFTKSVQRMFENRKLIGAEIGVQRGDNALTMIKSLSFECLYLIDIWESYLIATKYGEGFKNADFSNFYHKIVEMFGNRTDVSILKESSVEACERFSEGYFDFVYIDACHSYEAVKKDIEIWFPKIKKGGIFGGHDYSNEMYPGLKRAVDEFRKESGYDFFQESLDWWIIK